MLYVCGQFKSTFPTAQIISCQNALGIGSGKGVQDYPSATKGGALEVEVKDFTTILFHISYWEKKTLRKWTFISQTIQLLNLFAVVPPAVEKETKADKQQNCQKKRLIGYFLNTMQIRYTYGTDSSKDKGYP